MKNYKKIILLSIVLLITLACQALAQQLPNNETPLVTETPQATSTLEPITEKSLAGLIINSPVFGSAPGPYMGDYPIFGLGIVNRDGQIIEFAKSGQMIGYSGNSPHIVYQSFDFDSGTYGQLRSFNSETGETVDIKDELDGDKNMLAWLSGEPARFIYTNDREAYLFEAYGYFEGEEVLLADASNGHISLLLEHTFQSAANPDQSKIAYATGEQVYEEAENMQSGAGCFQPQLYDIATFTSAPFNVSSLEETPICMGYPQWSPDGNILAWVGYFEDHTFRIILFDIGSGNGKTYSEIPGYAGGQFPSGWTLHPYPYWVDDTTFWTANYEINTKTGETSDPRENPQENGVFIPEPLIRPDGRLEANLNEGSIEVKETRGTLLASYALLDMYLGDKTHADFANDEYRTYLVGWSPFAPPAGVVSIIPTLEPTPTTEPQFSCPGAPRARFQIGDIGRITFTDGTKTILRSSPEIQVKDNAVARLAEGTEFEVIGGPACYPRPGRNDAFVYWEILVLPQRNLKGWVAEGDRNSYYVEPLR